MCLILLISSRLFNFLTIKTMKKVLLTGALSALFINLSIGQQILDFESVTLSADSYDNGASGAGDFVFGQLTLSNVYDAQWGSWNGFSISNMSDNTTAGFSNQYSVYHGSGKDGSTNFAVYYPQGTISVAQNGVIDGFYITNTTYAAISMRDGDAFAKQFGSPNDANGTPDGTNGEDYFRVWIIGENGSGIRDSVLFYLADYRFADDNDDYIVDTWEYVDLTQLSVNAKKVEFLFESSDVGQWGINTPQYFAIDDINYTVPADVAEASIEVSVYPNPVVDVLTVNTEESEIRVFDLNGTMKFSTVNKGKTEIDMQAFPSGVYFVEITTLEGSAMVKVIK